MQQEVINPTENIIAVTHQPLNKLDLASLLSPAELQLLEAIPTIKKIRWVAGRLAAKAAIKQIPELTGHRLSNLDISLLAQPDGRPQVLISTVRNKSLTVSISHSQDISVAVADAGELKLGIDIEKIREFSEETIKAFMTKTEFSFYRQLSAIDQPAFVTKLWCIKEAILKAQGVGLSLHPARINIDFATDQAITKVSLTGKTILLQTSWTPYAKSYIIVYTKLL